jgi:uroporphyrinogen decarboxylase
VVKAAEKNQEKYCPTRDSYREQLDAFEYFGPDYAIPAPGYGLCIPRDPLWLEATLLRPDLVERHLDCQCVNACRQIEALKDLPLPYILGGGDFCGNNGPLYSPRIFHDMMLPRLQKMSATAHRCGKYVGFASDGNLWPIADDLFGASGTDAFYEIDHDAGMDLRKLRTRFPNLTCFGNISSATLHHGTRDQVIAETRENAEIALEFGGCLCGVSNQVVAPTPMENVLAMLETLETYR